MAYKCAVHSLYVCCTWPISVNKVLIRNLTLSPMGTAQGKLVPRVSTGVKPAGSWWEVSEPEINHNPETKTRSDPKTKTKTKFNRKTKTNSDPKTKTKTKIESLGGETMLLARVY